MKNYFFLPPPLPLAKEKTVMVRLLFFPRASARQLFGVSFSDFDVFARYDFGHCLLAGVQKAKIGGTRRPMVFNFASWPQFDWYKFYAGCCWFSN